jgi:hypothetical protein
MASKDNGNGKIADVTNESQATPDTNEETTPVVQTIGHPGNVRLLSIIGDYIFETREHFRRLEVIYSDLRNMTWPAPQIIGSRLLTEFERHNLSDTENIESLRKFVQQSSE